MYKIMKELLGTNNGNNVYLEIIYSSGNHTLDADTHRFTSSHLSYVFHLNGLDHCVVPIDDRNEFARQVMLISYLVKCANILEGEELNIVINLQKSIVGKLFRKLKGYQVVEYPQAILDLNEYINTEYLYKEGTPKDRILNLYKESLTQ